MEDTRSYNVGASDYAIHKYQPWDFWTMFILNPFDADILKRTLRTKTTDPRSMDYKKIKHIALERARQIQSDSDVFVFNSQARAKTPPLYVLIEDYPNLTDFDKDILSELLYNPDRLAAYNSIVELCTKALEELIEK